jgi:hypothetical protein
MKGMDSLFSLYFAWLIAMARKGLRGPVGMVVYR